MVTYDFCSPLELSMSGVLPIKAETLQLFADNPIQGPTPTQTFVSVSPTTGLFHIPSRQTLTLPSVAVAPGTSVELQAIGSTLSTTPGPVYPNPVSSPMAASPPATFTSPNVNFVGFQYGYIDIEMALNIRGDSLIAPTFAADQTAATLHVSPVFFSTGGPVLNAFEPFDTRIIHCFNAGTQVEHFHFSVYVPYAATRTALSARFQIQNNATGVDNVITVVGSSQIVYTVRF